ncbi:MAG: Calx-beta domain-containing protein [Microthrixaceae bacterium]
MIGRWRRRRRASGDRGATLVEFAVVSPLIFFMLGGMLDIGLTVLGRSVASGAAREGARVGIIHFENADIDLPVASPNNALIKAAVDAKLVGLVKPDTGNAPYVAVRCLDGGTKAAKACTRAGIRIDYDLIEVTVKWRSISATGGTFTPSNLTDVARMVIVGDAGGGGVACTGSSGTIEFDPTTEDVAEGGTGSTNVSLTVTRTGSSCPATVAYSTGPGDSNPATAGADYVPVPFGLITFFSGETSKDVTLTILGDAVPEPDETVDVTLSSPSSGTIGPDDTATVTIVNDDASGDAPELDRLSMFDDDGDGKIDRLTARFDEQLRPTCPAPGSFTFPTNGPGLSVQSVSIVGMVATVTLNEGSVDTSNANLAVALGAGCISDIDGNSATFTATMPVDNAAPVLDTVTDDDTSAPANGRFELNDWVDFTFSEPLDPATLGVAAADVALTDPSGNGSDSLAIGGLLSGSINLGSDAYLAPNNRTATFAGSTVAFTSANRVIRVTLGSSCSPANACGTNLTAGSGTVTFTFVTTLRALDGLSISSGPKSVALF